MNRIPDPIERGEMRAEAWADKNMKDGQFKCADCGDWCDDGDMQFPSPDPYSPPCCPICMEKYFPEI